MPKKHTAQSATPMTTKKPVKLDKTTAYEVRPEQSVDLLKALHILTNEGKINQDSRRKLKQIYHLFNFIKPLLEDILSKKEALNLVDHGAGKSYLGFIIYDLFFKLLQLNPTQARIYGIETRALIWSVARRNWRKKPDSAVCNFSTYPWPSPSPQMNCLSKSTS